MNQTFKRTTAIALLTVILLSVISIGCALVSNRVDAIEANVEVTEPALIIPTMAPTAPTQPTETYPELTLPPTTSTHPTILSTIPTTEAQETESDIFVNDRDMVYEIKTRGCYGILTIPSVGVDVALFLSSIWDIPTGQTITDRTDSAAYQRDATEAFGYEIIADHVHQGFGKIKQAVPGDTLAYINTGDQILAYICTDNFIGWNCLNGSWGLQRYDGTETDGQNDGGITMYTCNSDGTITITFWQPVD